MNDLKTIILNCYNTKRYMYLKSTIVIDIIIYVYMIFSSNIL